ncbi:MAG: tetratricopeptide repeat protein [Bryobacterales bacterium]|nr:tetratricopeptide repeat protein [Bryobacterales bacterium]
MVAKRFPALLCIVVGSSLIAQDHFAGGTWEEAARAASQLDREGKYAEAAAMLGAALKAAERLGVHGARLAILLNNMASLCQDTGRHAESEKLYQRALRIVDEGSGADPTLVLTTVNNLVLLYLDTGRYSASERLLLRYRPAAETLGPDAPETWTFMTNLATCDLVRRRFSEAEAAYKQVLADVERNRGPDPVAASLLTNLGVLYAATERYGEAAGFMERSLSLCRRAFGEGHPETIRPLLRISRVYAKSGRLAEGERFAKEALTIAADALGPEHPLTGLALAKYAFVLRMSGRRAEAKKLEKQAQAIHEKTARENPTRATVDIIDLLPIRELTDQGRRGQGKAHQGRRDSTTRPHPHRSKAALHRSPAPCGTIPEPPASWPLSKTHRAGRCGR